MNNVDFVKKQKPCNNMFYNALYKVRFNALYTLLALVRIINK